MVYGTGVSEYSLREASRILNVSAARIRYWERTALLDAGRLPGGPVFGFGDLLEIKSVLRLLDQGLSVRRIRRDVEGIRSRLPEIERPLHALRAWGGGRPRVVVRHGGVLFEPDGQALLDFDGAAEERVARLDAASPPDGAADLALAWFEKGCRLDTDPATYAAAAEAYRKAVQLDPDFADAYCNLGTVHFNQGRRDGAEECFRKALECEPDHVEAHFNLANLLEDAGRDEAALRHLKSVLRADPLYADGHLSLALLFEKLGLRRRAREHWRRYVQLEPAGSWADVARSRIEGGE